jgi:hypothetical protein
VLQNSLKSKPCGLWHCSGGTSYHGTVCLFNATAKTETASHLGAAELPEVEAAWPLALQQGADAPLRLQVVLGGALGLVHGQVADVAVGKQLQGSIEEEVIRPVDAVSYAAC